MTAPQAEDWEGAQDRRLNRALPILAVVVLLMVGLAARGCWTTYFQAPPETVDSHRYYPDLSNAAYGSKNPYVELTRTGNCAWFCWGRAVEKCGRAPLSGPYGSWMAEAARSGLAIGSEPRTDSIAVYAGSPGHVVFVEEIAGDMAYINEANHDTSPFAWAFWGGGYDGGGWHGDGGGADLVPVASLPGRHGRGQYLEGYIYLPSRAGSPAAH